MDVVVRTYTGKGSKELFSLLEERKAEIEKLLHLAAAGLQPETRLISLPLRRSCVRPRRASIKIIGDDRARSGISLHPAEIGTVTQPANTTI